MSDYEGLFWRDYAHQLSDRDEDQLSMPEKAQLDAQTAKLRQENPTEIGGYAVYGSESSFSGERGGSYAFYDTREAAQKAAAGWEDRPDYEAEIPGIHEPETVSHHARISPVTAAAMERITQGDDLDRGGGVRPFCTINGQEALCVEYEHGLNIRTPDDLAQQPVGLISGTNGGQSAPLIDNGMESDMSDDVEQTPPSNWTDRGGMVPQQESANDWAKEIAEAAYDRAQAGNEKAQEQGLGR